jgi:hypothetical protein
MVAILQALAWPAVTMVAIVALLVAVLQSLSGGRDVEMDWRLTEQITGHVTITRARGRAKKRRAPVAPRGANSECLAGFVRDALAGKVRHARRYAKLVAKVKLGGAELASLTNGTGGLIAHVGSDPAHQEQHRLRSGWAILQCRRARRNRQA